MTARAEPGRSGSSNVITQPSHAVASAAPSNRGGRTGASRANQRGVLAPRAAVDAPAAGTHHASHGEGWSAEDYSGQSAPRPRGMVRSRYSTPYHFSDSDSDGDGGRVAKPATASNRAGATGAGSDATTATANAASDHASPPHKVHSPSPGRAHNGSDDEQEIVWHTSPFRASQRPTADRYVVWPLLLACFVLEPLTFGCWLPATPLPLRPRGS